MTNRPLAVYESLPALRARLAEGNLVLFQAPPGAGKSTVVPIELRNESWLVGRRILMLEPRRLAARSVATRMARTLGQTVGQTVGYHIRFERRAGPATRVEVITEGILTRRLQSDPGLEGVGLIIFDEFHERGLDADLALALCRDAQRHLRDDLRILIMSATLDGGPLAAALGDPPALMTAGRTYPVDIQYLPRDVAGPLPEAAADAVTRALKRDSGDILVFLPGIGDITRAQAILAAQQPTLALTPLHGELSLEAQQRAIEPDAEGRRKVVLATSIAETSLTLEGVSVVIDTGYARVPRFDSRTGLTRLETVRVTADSAAQRAGRAGRLGPGTCHRLWSEETQARLLPVRRPEILDADLCPLRLELAEWGARAPSDLGWVTPPPTGAWRHATDLLEQLGALKDGVITARGRAMREWPTHPRLAHLLLEAGAARATLAADLAALLDERDPLPRATAAGADLSVRLDALRAWRAGRRDLHGADPRALARIELLAARWRQQLGTAPDSAPADPEDVGALVALAYPDRVAQARERGGPRYRLSTGRGARLAEGDPLAASPWLAAARLDDVGEEGRILLAAPLRAADLDAAAVDLDVVGWDAREGALVARRERRVGELVLARRPLVTPPAAARDAALIGALRAEGLDRLGWSDAARQWQARVLSLRVWRGDVWPDLSDPALMDGIEGWLTPWLDGVTTRTDLARLDALEMIRPLLSRRQLDELERLAPIRITVPSGSPIALSYAPDGSPPVLAVKLQEMFGLADTPAVNEGRTPVLLHLLSPARRPIQVTQDLRSFWTNTYPAVRKELRGRYNKHPWPEDPWNAPPTRKTLRAARGDSPGPRT